MLTIYQESVPFTNRRIESEVSEGTYLNPIIMPFALNSTQSDNILETVFYIKNTDVQLYYSDVVISLMKKSNTPDGNSINGIINGDASQISIGSYPDIPVTLAFNSAEVSGGTYSPQNLFGQFANNGIPVYGGNQDTPEIEVKFNYGYDQISDYRWDNLSSILLIPYIGNSTTPDTSYIPIRMRINFKTNPGIYTIRDYYLDVSYSGTGQVN